jgi:tetratricopeptide (TPR) repeat protein
VKAGTTMHEDLLEALALRQSGQHEEARELLLELVERYPDDAQVQYQTAAVHDAMGFEREAIPFYERALELGLPEPVQAGAMLGMGSTWRTLGEYDRAVEVLRTGADAFPDMRALDVFLAMALYNQGKHREAMERLLLIIVDTSEDDSIRGYERAIRYYADKLDQIW